MAKFGERFLASVANPAYGRGLFNVGAAFSAAPRLRREREEAEKLLQSNINNPTQLAKLEQQYRLRGKTDLANIFAKASVSAKGLLQQQGRDSISVIQQQLMAENDPVRMQQLEDAMVAVARQTGQADPSSLVGTALNIQDSRQRREDARIQRENQLFSRREAAIAQAYYGVSSEDKDKFIENAEKAGFGKIVKQLEVERLRHESYLEESEKRKADARSSLNIPDIEKRIKTLPENQQAQFKERLDEIKKLEPNFSKGETWGTGERERAWRQLDSLDRALFSANATILSTTNSRIKTLDSRLNTINKELEKPASPQEAKLYITQAVSEISAERGGFADYVLTDVDSSDDRVKQRAIKLATAKKNEALTQEKANIEAELVELQKTFEPATEKEEETEAEDPVGIR